MTRIPVSGMADTYPPDFWSAWNEELDGFECQYWERRDREDEHDPDFPIVRHPCKCGGEPAALGARIPLLPVSARRGRDQLEGDG